MYNILFIRDKIFTIKISESDDMLDHIHNVKSFADQLTCLEVPMKEKDVVMTLLDSLPPLFNYLFTASKTRLMKEFMLDSINSSFMQKLSKMLEKILK